MKAIQEIVLYMEEKNGRSFFKKLQGRSTEKLYSETTKGK